MQKPLNEVKIIQLSVIWKEYDLKFAVDNKSLFLKHELKYIFENLAQV